MTLWQETRMLVSALARIEHKVNKLEAQVADMQLTLGAVHTQNEQILYNQAQHSDMLHQILDAVTPKPATKLVLTLGSPVKQ
jgi:hypothetical protein